MAFKYNPATGKFENTTQPPVGKAVTPKVNIGKAVTPKVNIGQAKPSSPKIDARPPRTVSTTTSGGGGSATPPSGAGNVGPQLSEVVYPAPTGQAAIDAAWAALYKEAAAYFETYGEEPPASWYSARTSQIEGMQKRFDAAEKAAADRAEAAAKAGSAAAAAKLKAQQDELERQRKIKGGREAEAFLRQQADQTRASMLQRVAELYDPQKTATEAELTKVLEQANAAFDAAEGQVRAAGEDFTKGFTPSKAYSEIPLSTYTTAENPLLAALQQQGAGTGEVTAATEVANQFMAQQSALEKWAAGQLNVGQQNYDTAVQQAAKGGLAAALQGLAGRRADVSSGINKQFADQLAQIEQARTGAQMDIDQKIQDIITEANKTRAETTAEYGNLPKENEAAKVAAKKKKGAAAIAGIKANIEGR